MSFSAQGKKVKLVHSDEWLFDKTVSDAQRLKGNVQLEFDGNIFLCDSAYLYSNDDFDAFGNIRINRSPGYSVTGETMHFNRQENTAQLRNKITLRDKDMTLTTNVLNYNVETQVASYFGGGKIISNANKNVLTSEKGFYHGQSQVFYFRKDVVLTNPEYVVECDTMQYNNATEITYFMGPTNITGEKSSIYCETGYYNTRNDQCRFGQNSSVTSGKTQLRGDSIYYNGRTGIGEVFSNVEISDSTNSYIISGQYGQHNEITNRSFVTGQALMTQFIDGDSLFLHADTLRSYQDSTGKDLLLAYHGVRFFKKDLQGKCDSLTYSETDSTLRMFYSPLLWSDANQMSGDSIFLHTSDGAIQSLVVRNKSMIISAATEESDSSLSSTRFNQISGRNMYGTFIENQLHTVKVEGSGQVVYFPTSAAEQPTIMGHNKGESSNIYITVSENKISRIRLEKDTNSIYSPLKMANEKDFTLEGFNWSPLSRPISAEDVFRNEQMDSE